MLAPADPFPRSLLKPPLLAADSQGEEPPERWRAGEVGTVAGRTAIGLDIGTSSVRAAQVSVSKGTPVLERFGQVALPPGVVRDGEVVVRGARHTALDVAHELTTTIDALWSLVP